MTMRWRNPEKLAAKQPQKGHSGRNQQVGQHEHKNKYAPDGGKGLRQWKQSHSGGREDYSPQTEEQGDVGYGSVVETTQRRFLNSHGINFHTGIPENRPGLTRSEVKAIVYSVMNAVDYQHGLGRHLGVPVHVKVDVPSGSVTASYYVAVRPDGTVDLPEKAGAFPRKFVRTDRPEEIAGFREYRLEMMSRPIGDDSVSRHTALMQELDQRVGDESPGGVSQTRYGSGYERHRQAMARVARISGSDGTDFPRRED